MAEREIKSNLSGISLIAAVAENAVIGRDGGLPWKLPEDMRWFVRKTTGHAVIMGRRDFEAHHTPLPNRRNLLLTRQTNYHAPGIEVCHSLTEALQRVRDGSPDDDEPFVIGGSEVYAEALPYAQRMYLTHVHAMVEGDTFFPEFNPDHWQITTLWSHPADAKHFAGFTVKQYQRL